VQCLIGSPAPGSARFRGFLTVLQPSRNGTTVPTKLSNVSNSIRPDLYTLKFVHPVESDNPHRGPGRTRTAPLAEHNAVPEPEGFFVRVITPELAQTHLSTHNIPLLNHGRRVPSSMTLRQLKQTIAGSLGLGVDFSRNQAMTNTSPVCNCFLADRIATSGTWAMLRFRDPTSRGLFPPQNVNKEKDCPICSIGLNDPCADCEARLENSCPLVENAGCGHVFHHHCYTGWTTNTCPAGCSTRSETA
jgi:hypothetical protein